MTHTIIIAQITLGILLSITILLQNRGSSLGSSWGNLGMAYHSRRGFEKLLSRTTIVLAVLFISISGVAVLV